MPSQRRTAVPWGVPHSHLGGRLTRGGLGRPLAPVAGATAWGLSRPAGRGQRRLSSASGAPRLAQPGRVSLRGRLGRGRRVDRKHTAGGHGASLVPGRGPTGGTAVRAGGAAGRRSPLLIAGPCVSAAQTEGDSRGAVPRQLGAAGLVPFPSRRAGRTPVVPSLSESLSPVSQRWPRPPSP